MKKVKRNGPSLGLALGAGGARGFVHLGVLKTLQKHKINPDYLAGTSMGAVIAAAYAVGRTPLEIEEFMKHTDWRRIVDFTVPKAGLLEGKRVNQYLQELVFRQKIQNTVIPLQIISYNLTKKKQVIFQKGDIASALRASISIPGIFNPYLLKKEEYIDGAISDPTPFDIVKKMGAEIILAIDTTSPRQKPSKVTSKNEATFLTSLKEEFIKDEVRFLGTILFPERWPKIFRKSLRWLLQTILYPTRVLRIITGKELYPIAKTLYETINILQDNLAQERLAQAKDCIVISPSIDGLSWSDFDKIDRFIKIGEEATEKIIPKLKKRLKLHG
ncbi:patatin-like phospholipase family protein [Candidatus Woesearchaeota archaeon]|nr:patatin-like phospholipase family protein [Candidatus Woesearchaeota archaeon]